MPPTTRDLNAATELASGAKPSEDASVLGQSAKKLSAVGAEVPVVVHASRYSSAARGSGKGLPPVHEETRTVIIFPNGAVVRISASMVIGELVVLTNQNTGADVISRVTSVKAQPGIQNYVNLEFTQRAPGFWGTQAPVENGSGRSQAAISQSPKAPDATVKTEAPKPAAVIEEVRPKAADPMPPAPVQVAPVIVSLPEPERPQSAEKLETLDAPVAVQATSNSILGGGSSLGLNSNSSPAASWSSLSGASTEPDRESAGSKKIVLIAVAAVVLLGLGVAGGALLFRQSAPVAPLSSSVPIAPQGESTAALDTAPADSELPYAEPAPVQGGADPGQLQPAAISSIASVRQEAPLAVPALAQPSVSPGAVTRSAPEMRETPIPALPPSRRPGIEVGKLSAPMARKAGTGGTVEAPPTLAGASPGMLGLGEADRGNALAVPARPAAQLQPPRALTSPAPHYPAMGLSQHVQGTVVIDALIDTAGKVASMKVITGPPLLQQAALDALRTWRYDPARRDGQPVATHTQVNIRFQLP